MRQRGTGSLYKQKGSEVWWMKYYVHGAPRRESSGKRDWYGAAEVLKLRLSEIAVNGDFGSSALTIRALVQMKFRANRVEGLSDLANPERRWKLHLESFFGNLKVINYSSDLVNQYIEKRRKEGASGSSIDKEIQVIRGAFSYGMKMSPPLVKALPFFPMTHEDCIRQVFIDNEEDKEKLRAAAAKEAPYMLGLVEIALTYGWRRGSLFGMRVKDVDIFQNTLHTGVNKNGETIDVPLLPNIKAALLPCMGRKGWSLAHKLPDDWLFTHRDGSKVVGYRKAWKRVLKAAGLNPNLRFHDLRRTARTAMADRDMDESFAMALMGHKTNSMSKRYTIRNLSSLREAAKKLEIGHSTGIATMPEAAAGG